MFVSAACGLEQEKEECSCKMCHLLYDTVEVIVYTVGAISDCVELWYLWEHLDDCCGTGSRYDNAPLV